MSYRIDVKIEKLYLRIPRQDLPLKSNVIVGWEFPKLVYWEDECCEACFQVNQETSDSIVFSEANVYAKDYDEWADEVISLCKKYQGTFIANLVGEDGETTYVRIRGGIEKILEQVPLSKCINILWGATSSTMKISRKYRQDAKTQRAYFLNRVADRLARHLSGETELKDFEDNGDLFHGSILSRFFFEDIMETRGFDSMPYDIIQE